MSTNTHNNLIAYYTSREQKLLVFCERRRFSGAKVDRLLTLSSNRLMLAEELGRAWSNREVLATRLNNGLRVSL